MSVATKGGDQGPRLSTSDFSLSLGGHPQLIQSAQEIAPIVVGTNRDKVPFIILDSLGSREQNAVRTECLQMLADSAVKGLPISLSEIDSDGLHEVHSVATPDSVLASALEQLDHESHLLGQLDALKAATKTSDDRSTIAAELDRLRRFRKGNVHLLNMMGTIQAQLNALRQLASALRNAKGRKTAIWLTGYFPIDVNEAEGSLNIENWNTTSGFPVKAASIEYQRTVDLLNDSQISIFPVQLTSGRAGSNLPGPVTADHIVVGLRLVARSTGGEEMVLADGIDSLVQRALAKSTNYYLISIQAESRRDLTWASLKIETNDKSLQVRSPNGLFLFP